MILAVLRRERGMRVGPATVLLEPGAGPAVLSRLPSAPAAGPALGAPVPPRAALQGGGSCTPTTPLLEWPGTRVCRVSPARRPHPAERQRAPVTREAEQRPGPERGAARSRRGRTDARQPCSFPRGWGKSPRDRTFGGRRLSSAELFYQLKKP